MEAQLRGGEDRQQPFPMPCVLVHRPTRGAAEDKALSDQRVHGLVDGQLVEELLRDAHSAGRVLGLRRGDRALIDRAADMDASPSWPLPASTSDHWSANSSPRRRPL